MVAGSGPNRDQHPVVARAEQRSVYYPVIMSFGKTFSLSATFFLSHFFSLILDLSCLTATGRSWVLPQVSALTPPRGNAVRVTSFQNTQKGG